MSKLLLEDSARLQEQDADFANRKGFSKHAPARPLYETKDVSRCLRQFSSVAFDKEHRLSKSLSLTLKRAGHILGAASVQVNFKGKKIVFSGDIGRYNDPIMVDPEGFCETDFLVVESTYGNRTHDNKDPKDILEKNSKFVLQPNEYYVDYKNGIVYLGPNVSGVMEIKYFATKINL